MNLLTVTLAFVQNLTCFFCGMAVIAGVVSIVVISNAAMDSDIYDKPMKETLKGTGYLVVLGITVLFGLLACLPSVDDLWKVRIGLIKYELASPQNVQKATDEIASIGHKLECKYLGCKEEKKQ